MSVIVWIDGAHDAPANMARDRELLACAEAGQLPTTVLRLFTFSPPGITLGRSQVPERELDLARLEREGMRWSLRPTGGRAIYHDEDWTFSLTTSTHPHGWADSPGRAYARTGRLLESALRRLGVPAVLAPGTPRASEPGRSEGAPSPPCFASSARHELGIAGRKLAGIAQRAVRGALLQQGSILLGDSHLRLVAYRPVGDDASRAGEAATLQASTTTAGHYLGKERSLSRLGTAIAEVLGAAEIARGEAGARRLVLTSPPRPSS